MSNFVSLHNHSSLSFSDALISVKELVKIAKHYNSPAVAITEHGHAASLPVFFKECEKEGIKPILGAEFYFMWDEFKRTEKSSYHLLVNVQNEKGYENFLKLMYLSNIPADQGGGFYGRPRITEKMLFEHKEGLIVSSSCVQGPIAALLLEDRDMDAALVAEEFRDKLGSNFFIEIMPHRLEIQVKVNKRLIEIGRRLGIPVITSLDTHLPSAEYNEAYTCNGDLRRNKTNSDRSNNQLECITDWDLHYKSEDEIIRIYDMQDIPKGTVMETLRNTLAINDMINFTWEKRKFEPPKFCEDADDALRKLLWDKLKDKFGGKENVPLKYIERMKYEYGVIKSMGYANYFLILHDAIAFCDRNGFVRGPGRGSAGGCLIAWTLNITLHALDPIKFNLPFERFLNPERKDTFPDVDLDLLPEGREKLIMYLKERWGDTRVIQVANHAQIKLKAALKDTGKWLEIPFADMNAITAAIPAKGYDEDGEPMEMTLDEAIKIPAVAVWAEKFPKLFEIAKKLEGSYRQSSIHAGAVCILPDDAEKIIPVQKKKNDTGADVMVSQFDKKMLEAVGIHKYDFLGLSTLAILAELETMTGISTAEIPEDDQKTWKFLQEAKHMLGIFQFIENKTKGILRQILPSNLNELADVNTLIRPGADLNTYTKNKNGKKIVYQFDLPEVREELEKTYGSIIYQENIMNLCKSLAGFSLGEGDLIRRALEKNDTAKIAAYKERFVQNCKYPDIAPELFDWIGANANYLFNQSHALAYSMIGYWCAFYKANYPEAFLVANLNHPKDTAKKGVGDYIHEFITEGREMGISISLPVMGACSPRTMVRTKVVYYGLSGIKGISEKTAEVLAGIEAPSFENFVEQAIAIKARYVIRGKESFRSVINKGHLLSLCKIGFFGEPGPALEKFNAHFGTDEPTDLDGDATVNDALGFEWFSPLLKYYDVIDDTYRDNPNFLLVVIKHVKPGTSARGYKYTLVKGTSPSGEFSGFLNSGTVGKGDVILARIKPGRGDSISFDVAKLLN